MSHKLSLKDIKSPDRFFKSLLNLVKYLRHNVKLYLTLSAVVVAITAAISIVNYIHDSRQENARKEFYKMSLEIQKLNTNDVNSVIKIIEGNISKLGNTDAGMEATYMLGELYYNQKDWDSAMKNYEKVVDKGNGLIKELATLGVAYTKENKADLKGALDAFNLVRDIKTSSYSAVAAIGAGRCYQKLGDKSRALAAYEAIIISYPDTDYARQASTAKASL